MCIKLLLDPAQWPDKPYYNSRNHVLKASLPLEDAPHLDVSGAGGFSLFISPDISTTGTVGFIEGSTGYPAIGVNGRSLSRTFVPPAGTAMFGNESTFAHIAPEVHVPEGSDEIVHRRFLGMNWNLKDLALKAQLKVKVARAQQADFGFEPPVR